MAMLLAASDYSTAHAIGEITAIALLAAGATALGLRARRPGRASRARTTDGLAALVCVALLAGGVAHAVRAHRGGGSFDTPQGRQLHAGFLAGCEQGGAPVDCGCVWEHLTSGPPYDTPEGFAGLAGPMSEAERTQSAAGLPPQLLAALTSCRAG